MRRRLPAWCGLALLALAACSFDASGSAPAVGDDGDPVGGPDAAPPAVNEPEPPGDDAAPPPPPPDAAPDPVDAEPRRGYGERCDRDEDCRSNACIRWGDDGRRQCTKSCESNGDCPGDSECNREIDLCVEEDD